MWQKKGLDPCGRIQAPRPARAAWDSRRLFLRALEVELDRQTHETRAQQSGCLPILLDDRRRRVVNGVERVLIRPDRVTVEQVVDVNADVQALVGEPDVLGELQV